MAGVRSVALIARTLPIKETRRIALLQALGLQAAKVRR
jgi:hypothetical protein